MKQLGKVVAWMLAVTLLLSAGAALAETQEKSIVSIMGPWIVESPEDKVLGDVVEGFEEAYPQYEVELIGVPSADVLKTTLAMAAANTLPDLVISNGSAIAACKDMGIIEDVRAAIGEEYLSGIYPEMLAEFMIGDELFGLPLCAAPFVLILRKDLLDAAGLAVPENFEEIVNVAEKLTVDTDGDGKIDRYGMSLMGFPDGNNALRFIMALFAADAPDVYADADGKWQTAIGSENSLRAFKLYYDLAVRNQYVPVGATEVDYKTMVNLLSTDQVAMAISGPHTIGTIINQNPEMDGKFIAVPLKDLKTVAYLNSYGMLKFANTPNREGAVAFLKYAAENFVEMTRVTKRLPSVMALASEASMAAPEVAAILDCAQYNIAYAPVTFRGDVLDAIAIEVNAMLSGMYDSPEAACEAMRAAMQAILDESN